MERIIVFTNYKGFIKSPKRNVNRKLMGSIVLIANLSLLPGVPCNEDN